jgi:Ca2+-binding EF-hand superfamily protein
MNNELEKLNQADSREIQELLENRAAELFRLCDLDEKGFINKQDIHRMKEPFGFSPDLLDQVFESLDTDKNGFLTLQEFTIGFSGFMENQVIENINSISTSLISDEPESDEDVVFEEAMQSLGATELVKKLVYQLILIFFLKILYLRFFSCATNIKELWFRLRNENQDMLKTFEFFIENVSKEVKRTKNENFELESLFSRYIALIYCSM